MRTRTAFGATGMLWLCACVPLSDFAAPAMTCMGVQDFTDRWRRVCQYQPSTTPASTAGKLRVIECGRFTFLAVEMPDGTLCFHANPSPLPAMPEKRLTEKVAV